MIGSSSILEPKCHYLETIKTSISDKRGIFLIWSIHGDLVVLGVRVQEAEQLVSSGGIGHLVYPGNGKAILRADLIEVYEIYVYPPIPVVFLYEDWVRNPMEIFSLVYEPIMQ